MAITQRDLNYYEFLKDLKPAIISRIRDLFSKMRFTFPDSCWVFDVYIPEAYYTQDTESEDSDSDEEAAAQRRNGRRLARARLIDINPWAPRTDTLLFGWDELLDIQVARPILGSAAEEEDRLPKRRTVRLPIRLAGASPSNTAGQTTQGTQQAGQEDESESETTEDDIGGDGNRYRNEDEDSFFEDEEEEEHEPELRIVEHDDPAAYNFSSPQYSAHKLPREVVDASMAGDGGMREFAQRWQRIVEGRDQGSR